MADKIRMRRGNKAQLPTLDDGELGLCEDTKELFIGSSSGNVQVATKSVNPWTTPTLLNGWTNYSAPENPISYKKDELGWVHIRGSIKGGAVTPTTKLFTLPPGYRPAFNGVFICLSNNSTSDLVGHVNVLSNGDVTFMSGSNALLSLDQIIFLGEL